MKAPSFYPTNSFTGITRDTWNLWFCPLNANFGARIIVIINGVLKVANHNAYVLVRTCTGVMWLTSKTMALLSWQSFKVAMPVSSEASCYTTSTRTPALTTLQRFFHCLPPFVYFVTTTRSTRNIDLSFITDISLIFPFWRKPLLTTRHSKHFDSIDSAGNVKKKNLYTTKNLSLCS